MDPIEVEKFEAMNNYNKSSFLKNPKSNNNAFIVYILTALSCSLVFFSPFWYPSMESLLIMISLPNLISHLVTPKCLFIVGNLIVFVLVGESKLHTSNRNLHEAADEEFYHEYLSRSRSLNQQRPFTSDHNVIVHSECKKLSEITRSSSVNRRLRPIRKVDSMIKGKRELCSSKGSVVRSLSAEELSKRADDFIARVNRQRRIEASST